MDECDWGVHYIDKWANNLPKCNGNGEIQILQYYCNNEAYCPRQSGFVGTKMPPEIALMTSLIQIDLFRMDINARFEDILTSHLVSLPNLVALRFGDSNLYGSIPSRIGDLQKLKMFSIGEGKFTGLIPTEIGKLSLLEHLDLSDNTKLEGIIPAELFLLTNLVELYLNDAGFSGAVSSQFAQLTALTSLALHNTQLTGTIPIDMCYWLGLTEIQIECTKVQCPATCTTCKCLR